MHMQLEPMPGAPGVLTTGIARTLINALRERGVNVDQALRQSAISPHRLGVDRSCVTAEQLASLIRALWIATEDELMGLGPHPVPLGTFRLLTLAMISAPDLRSAVQRSHAFSRILPGIPTCTVEVDGATTRIVLEATGFDEALHIVQQWSLAVGHRFLSWLVGRRIALRTAELPFPMPRSTAVQDVLFGTPATFGTPRAAITFDSGLLLAPVVQTNDTLRDYLRHCPERWLTQANLGTNLVDHVRAALTRGLRGDWPSAEEVSSLIGTSPQTLRRHLREHGTSLTEIKEELQRDVAIASLTHGTEPVSELARRLGFSEPSAFHRAFRRWTGCAPGAFRARSTPQQWAHTEAEGA